jgi:sRNA-binding regulator protein Hfq
MNSQVLLPSNESERQAAISGTLNRRNRSSANSTPFRFTSYDIEDGAHRQAELFYLQKQIHSQTPMVIVLEDGEKVEGCIEWYDRGALKVRGTTKVLIYKSSVKYMYKVGEAGHQS